MYISHLIIAVGFFIFCLLNGAYFPIQYTVLFFMLLLGYLIKRDFKINYTVLFFLSMFIPLIFSAIFKSRSLTIFITEIIKYSLIPLSYALFLVLDEKDKIVDYIYIALVLLAILGLLAYFNIINIYDGVLTLEYGRKLQSVWQNANTNALFMAIGILLSMYYIINQERYYCIVPALIFIFNFFAAKSQITTIILFFAVFIYLIWEMDSSLIKIIISAVFVLITLFMIIFAGKSIQLSLAEDTPVGRMLVLKDALQYLKSHFILGTGIGNWNKMQYIIQSQRYTVKYVHCFLVQLMLDGGILTALLYIVSVASGLVFRKKNNIYVCLVMLIFTHSLFDFTMNYAVSIIMLTLFLSCCKISKRTVFI